MSDTRLRCHIVSKKAVEAMLNLILEGYEAMKHEPVESSTVSTVGYDEDKQQLHVTYNTGKTYVYHDVPPETHQALMLSSSKGKFLHANVKGRHEHTKL